MIQQHRAAFAAFEKQILDLYDQELLTLHLLDCIASQYGWLPIGSAGTPSALTCDGKELSQVCIEVVEPSFFIPSRGSQHDHEEQWEKEIKKWESMLRYRWNWRPYHTVLTDLPHERAA